MITCNTFASVCFVVGFLDSWIFTPLIRLDPNTVLSAFLGDVISLSSPQILLGTKYPPSHLIFCMFEERSSHATMIGLKSDTLSISCGSGEVMIDTEAYQSLFTLGFPLDHTVFGIPNAASGALSSKKRASKAATVTCDWIEKLCLQEKNSNHMNIQFQKNQNVEKENAEFQNPQPITVVTGVFDPVVAGAREHLEKTYAKLKNTDRVKVHVLGSVWEGIYAGETQTQRHAQITYCKSLEQPPCIRLSPMIAGGLWDVCLAVEQGCDLVRSDYPVRMCKLGYALVFDPEFDPKFAVKTTTCESVMDVLWEASESPIVQDCGCFCCKTYHRAYVSHLFAVDEMLGGILLSIHNHWMFAKWFDVIRSHVARGTFGQYKELVKQSLLLQ